MKVGIFLDGQLRMTDHVINMTLRIFADAFPGAEFVYAVWEKDYEERKELIDTFEGTVELIKKYDIHYHPYEENRDAVNTKTSKEIVVSESRSTLAPDKADTKPQHVDEETRTQVRCDNSYTV